MNHAPRPVLCLAHASEISRVCGDFDSVRMKIRGRIFAPSQLPMPDRFIVRPGYFSLFRIPLIKGRLFNDADDAQHPLGVIINQLLAEQFFRGQDPIGQQIQIPSTRGGAEQGEPYRTIVGVVGDVVQNGPASHKTIQVYAPYSQYACERSNLVFRTTGDPLPLAAAVRWELHNIDATLIAPEFAAMDKVVAASIVE
jgi:putative ABC transport system permease protein